MMISNKPLSNVLVLEMSGLAPSPFCGMILSDFGARVIRIDRVNGSGVIESNDFDQLTRGKDSIGINLKTKQGIEILLKLIEKANVIIDCYRPNVMEKMGLGPTECHKINPNLIYARLTGFGQSGIYSKMAGHDINYLALSGILSLLGRKNENPIFPVNLLADFAGGGLMCAFGILLSLFEQKNNPNRKIVVDCSMMNSVTYLGIFAILLKKSNDLEIWNRERGENMLDSGSHYYEVYKTKDSKYLSVGAIEPHFYQNLLVGLGFTSEEIDNFPPQNDRTQWPKMKIILQDKILQKTRDEWETIFIGTDSCVAPVLDINEIKTHQHSNLIFPNNIEKSFTNIPPQPNLSFYKYNNNSNFKLIPGSNTIPILKEFGFSPREIDEFISLKVINNHTNYSRL